MLKNIREQHHVNSNKVKATQGILYGVRKAILAMLSE